MITWVVMAGLASAAVRAPSRGSLGPLTALATGAVLAALLIVALLLQHRASQAALRLIMLGREQLPLLAVARERCRLLDPSARERLASRFEYYARDAARPSRAPLPASRPLAELIAARALGRELLTIAALIREAHDARGVAHAEQLLTHGALITWGGDEEALRRQLRRTIERLTCA